MSENNKITLLFPGQGSQYVGMGKDLYDNFGCVKDIYEQEKGQISEVQPENSRGNSAGLRDIVFKTSCIDFED